MMAYVVENISEDEKKKYGEISRKIGINWPQVIRSGRWVIDRERDRWLCGGAIGHEMPIAQQFSYYSDGIVTEYYFYADEYILDRPSMDIFERIVLSIRDDGNIFWLPLEKEHLRQSILDGFKEAYIEYVSKISGAYNGMPAKVSVVFCNDKGEVL